MSALLLVLAKASELPAGDAWLGPQERAALRRLRAPKRRRDFRLGRFAARRALLCLEGGDASGAPSCFEVRPAPGGAPLAFREGAPLAVTLSISHSEGRAAAAVQRGGGRLGCDLERVEARSPAFVADYFTRSEREFVAAGRGDGAQRATLVWSAKEAVMKALGEGLRLPPATVAVVPALGPVSAAGWRPFSISHPAEGTSLRGFWRALDGLVLTVAGELGEPRLVESPATESRT